MRSTYQFNVFRNFDREKFYTTSRPTERRLDQYFFIPHAHTFAFTKIIGQIFLINLFVMLSISTLIPSLCKFHSTTQSITTVFD